MKFCSTIITNGMTNFPAFLGERVYMKEFYKNKGLPEELKRWQPTIDDMLDGVNTDGPIYVMIDQTFVKSGSAQRRPGLHIDGYWNPAVEAHGGTTGRHSNLPSRHSPLPSHRSTPSRHGPAPSHHTSGASSWEHSTFEAPEAVILTSSVSGAVGYTGEFEGPIREGGDCSHIDLTQLYKFRMEANKIYVGNVTALHESVPVVEDSFRTLVRLNVPGWTV